MGGNLYHGSFSLPLAHEDKTYPGALIASLSIPWGEAKGDEDTAEGGLKGLKAAPAGDVRESRGTIMAPTLHIDTPIGK